MSTTSIPTALKVAYTAFMAVLVPVYWYFYGPTNFLYFCDVALLLTLVGIWRGNALLVSMCRGGHPAAATLWVTDFAAGFAGVRLTGMTDYMFNPNSRCSCAACRSSTAGCRSSALSGLAARLRPPGAGRLDRPGLGAAARVLRLHARADGQPGAAAGEHQLRLGHERHRPQTMMPPLASFATLLPGPAASPLRAHASTCCAGSPRSARRWRCGRIEPGSYRATRRCVFSRSTSACALLADRAPRVQSRQLTSPTAPLTRPFASTAHTGPAQGFGMPNSWA